MKVTNVKDFKNKATNYLKADEPTLVVRHGKVAGLLLPLQDIENLPLKLQKEVLLKLEYYQKRNLKVKDISEAKIFNDFKKV